MHFDTLPFTDTIYVAYCKPEFDLGQMYREITMPEKSAWKCCHLQGISVVSLIGAIFDLCHLLLRK